MATLEAASGPQTRLRMSAAEYLRRERDPARSTEPKSEFLYGEVTEMPGASRVHDRIVKNVLRVLLDQVDGRTGEVGTSDLKVGFADDGYQYPDASVAGLEVETLDSHLDVVTNPVVLFEVLSPSTEAADRGKKFRFYRTIPSLRVYVLIAQDDIRVERSRRDDDEWPMREIAGEDAVLEIAEIGLALPLSEIYRGVSFVESEPNGI